MRTEVELTVMAADPMALGSLASNYCVRRRYASPSAREPEALSREGDFGETNRSPCVRRVLTVGSPQPQPPPVLLLLEGDPQRTVHLEARGACGRACVRSLVVCKETHGRAFRALRVVLSGLRLYASRRADGAVFHRSPYCIATKRS